MGLLRENLDHAGIAAIGRGNDGAVVFMLSIYKGQYSNNLMESLAIKIVVERGCSLGWKKRIFESNSQIVLIC